VGIYGWDICCDGDELRNKKSKIENNKVIIIIIGLLFLAIGLPSFEKYRQPAQRWLLPIFFVGQVSYSWFLTHQPILAFARLLSVHELSNYEIMGLIGVSFVFAIVLWRFIEVPFLAVRGAKKTYILFGSGAFCVAFILMGAFGHYTRGWEARLGSDVDPLIPPSHLDSIGRNCNEANCKLGNTTKPLEVIVAGDSDASNLTASLEKYFIDCDIHGQMFGSGGVFFGEFPDFYPDNERLNRIYADIRSTVQL